jgi:ferredoxin-nitrite reductase
MPTNSSVLYTIIICSPRRTGKGVLLLSLLTQFVSCPGIFYRTSSKDGILLRLRLPGGILSSHQFRIVADLADKFASGYVHITNRANLQIRQILADIPVDVDVLRGLRESGIVKGDPQVDHLRNIMGSPTAGIDPYELIDTRPLIRELDNYISTQTELALLSPKFSVAFDGNGSVSISDRLNDILMSAVMVDTSVYFCLKLNLGTSLFERSVNVGVLLKPEECLGVVAAIAKVYLQHLELETEIPNPAALKPNRKSHKPRLFEIVNNLGIERFLQEVERHLPYPLQRFPCLLSNVKMSPWECKEIVFSKYQHIGIHPQRQQGLSYIGVVIPVGKLLTCQIRSLADIAETYGSGVIRLTPWQNLLLSDIPNALIPSIQSQIENIGLHWSATNIHSALVACTGNVGCASSATDTKSHALILAEYLEQRLTIDQPVNIHFTGCEKSCAQHTRSDITLLGASIEEEETIEDGYKVYVGDGESNEKFGRELYHCVPFAQIPPLILQMLEIYITKRATPNESFGKFTNHYEIADLKNLFPQIANN